MSAATVEGPVLDHDRDEHLTNPHYLIGCLTACLGEAFASCSDGERVAYARAYLARYEEVTSGL